MNPIKHTRARAAHMAAAQLASAALAITLSACTGTVQHNFVQEERLQVATDTSANLTAAQRVRRAGFIRPAEGEIVGHFDGVHNRGIDIAGRPGDPILAAADGRVVYVGDGLRGYGNLVIVQHDGDYMTAYAHNQQIFVREDEPVSQGQRIADMGSSDADRVKVHFELRKGGTALDPQLHLQGEPR